MTESHNTLGDDMACKDCNGKGKLKIHRNGRVMTAYCHCPNGERKESERDTFVRSIGSSVESDRLHRLKYKKGENKRY